LPSVVACTWGLDSAEEAAALLTVARRCGEVTWLSLGSLPDDASAIASRFGVARLQQIAGPKLESSASDARLEAFAQYCEQAQPRLILMNQAFDSRLIAPRLAGRLATAVAMNALDIEVRGDETRVSASAYGGDTNAVYALRGPAPHIVAVMSNTVAAEPAPTPTNPSPEEFPVDLSGVLERVRVVTPAHAEGARLEDAQVIVAGGRGLGTSANFHLIEELAEAVGGMPAASRPLVDDGWTEASRQVGLTGRITRPALYFALGISGASQHMAGCSAAGTIVAVNHDPDAAIFRYAKYGIVGDCLEIIPELIAAVRED
jgi:electron transfer flavoprotein alpha subunit